MLCVQNVFIEAILISLNPILTERVMMLVLCDQVTDVGRVR